jgi:hypothetical protein
LELFRQCGICSFSVRYWSCSDIAVFVVLLLDIVAVPTVRYLGFFCSILELFRQCSICCFSVRYWSCSDSVVFFVFLLDIGAVHDSAVFVVFLLDIGAVQIVWYLFFFF